MDKSDDDDPADAGAALGGSGNPSGWWEFAAGRSALAGAILLGRVTYRA